MIHMYAIIYHARVYEWIHTLRESGLKRACCIIHLNICVAVNTHRVAVGVGLVRPWVQLSHRLLAVWFPMAARTCVSSPGQSSRSSERTRDRWVPRLRWIPEHSMQMSAPRLRLAQVGSAARRQRGDFTISTRTGCTTRFVWCLYSAVLTWCLAVDAQMVALGVADGLQRYSLTLAAPPSLQQQQQQHTDARVQTRTTTYAAKNER